MCCCHPAWDRVFNLNVKAMFTMTREAAPLLDAGATAQDPGRVINIGSIAGTCREAKAALYNTQPHKLTKAYNHKPQA